jgi:hypothetical protein
MPASVTIARVHVIPVASPQVRQSVAELLALLHIGGGGGGGAAALAGQLEVRGVRASKQGDRGPRKPRQEPRGSELL